ncbi:hypothetical protein KKI23_00780, partial [Patescibacteria group bacterium]|nr:hypothetical protein [Patescibacteria group bacterium]
MEETKQLGLKWKPSNYFIVGGVAVCLGVIILVMGKLFTSYLFFLAGFIFLLWPISRLLSSKHFFLTTLSVIVFDLIAYYFITRQYAN